MAAIEKRSSRLASELSRSQTKRGDNRQGRGLSQVNDEIKNDRKRRRKRRNRQRQRAREGRNVNEANRTSRVRRAL